MAPKKLTDCPENLREAIDWLIQIKNGGDGKGLGRLAEALKKLIADAIGNAYITNVGALLKLLNSAKSYTCCEDKVAEIDKIKEPKISTDYLNTLLQRVKDVNECSKNHIESSQQKSYEEIVSKLDQLKNLKESLKGITVEKNCEELLTNLCEGLETFLGFNSTSKGYTGTGIVYSDLDRLCDGVMGFLSGVLGAVKNENEVTTYDNYIENENNKLEKVVDTLTNNIGSGRAGLVASVAEVKGWLEGYEREVEERTGNVTKNINELIIDKINDKITDINNAQSSGCEAIHYAFQTSVADIEHYMWTLKNNKEGYKALDNTLKSKLDISVGKIDSAVDVMNKSSRNAFLTDQAAKVDETLVTEMKAVEETINNNVEELRWKMVGEFKNIRAGIQSLEDVLYKQTYNINTRLKDGQKLVNGFDEKYKKDIIGRFNLIRHEIERVRDTLSSKKRAVADLLSSVKRAVGVVKTAVKKDNSDAGNRSIEHHWEELKEELTKLVGGLISRNESKPISLVDICEGIKTYAAGFLSRFESKITQMVEAILKDETVRGYIENYVRHNEKHFKAEAQQKITGAGNNGIAAFASNTLSPIIVARFKSYIAEKVKQTINHTGDVHDVIRSIQGYLAAHALAVEPENADSVITKIETDADLSVNKDTPDTPRYNDIYLKQIVTIILTAVSTVVTISTAELVKLTSGTPMINLKGAIDKIRTTSRYIDSTGRLISDALGDVKAKIGEIEIYLQGTDQMLDDKYYGIQYVISELEELKKERSSGDTNGAIEHYREETDHKMNELRNNIQQMLDGIDVAVGHTNDSLDTAIKDVRIILKKCQDRIYETVENLRIELTKKVREVFSEITKQVRTMFASQKISDLSALRSLVDQQLKAVQGIIAEDRVTGVKGMLSKLRDKYVGKLDEFVPKTKSQDSWKDKTLHELAEKANEYFYNFFGFLQHQPDFAPFYGKVQPCYDTLTNMLQYIKTSKHFDNVFTTLLERFNSALHDFVPKNFSTPCSPLLAPLKRGLLNFTAQLGHAYVNRYSGGKFQDVLTKPKPKDAAVETPAPQTDNYDLTYEGRNCAKVCLTIVEMLFNDFEELKKACANDGEDNVFTKKHIRLYDSTVHEETHENALGRWFQQRGFRVSDDEQTHNGELRNKGCDGNHMYMRLIAVSKGIYNKFYTGPTVTLHRRLVEYYKVYHLSTSTAKKHPSSVYEMLVWLSGLPHNPVYQELTFGVFDDLFEKPKDQASVSTELGGISVDNLNELHLAAYPRNITVDDLSDALTYVCHYSRDVLISILGHGHSGGTYAVDFCNNSFNLHYPSVPSQCLDILVDVLYRLYDQLYFLFIQCQRRSDTNSWRDCWYGRFVGGSSWTCNDRQCANQSCPQIANQKADQTGNQRCDQHPSCGLKSPLQSFLEDGLPGFLPHQFKKPGCKLECSTANHRGIPCKTPMGFADIANAASHTKMGAEICAVLSDFCGGAETPLGKMCSYFICILQRTPQTLGDMFAFYYNFMVSWNQSGTKHRSYAFNNAVTKAYFGKQYSGLDVNSLLNVGPSSNQNKGNLMCLVDCNDKTHRRVTCGRYLHSFGIHTWRMFAEKHAGNYLSWVVYLTETFYKLLYQLYEECCNKCNKPGTRCHGKICPDSCGVKSAYQSQEPLTQLVDKHHTKDCKSIAACPFTRPILYKHGFTLKSLSNLSGINGTDTIRTCQDFCEQLKIIVDENSVLLKMFYTIDDFLLAIRAPFIWLNVALWLLSLLYLIHIMIIRLDLLHIKSHLHSPSSHRIAAQSLLAAARVNKLAKLTYLQP